MVTFHFSLLKGQGTYYTNPNRFNKDIFFLIVIDDKDYYYVKQLKYYGNKYVE